MDKIELEIEREPDDDCWIYTVTAKRGGLSVSATGYTEATATARAIARLNQLKKEFGPKTPGWENSVESFLCR